MWFHLHCIGLTPEQVSEDQDFICITCKPTYNKKVKLIWNLKGGLENQGQTNLVKKILD